MDAHTRRPDTTIQGSDAALAEGRELCSCVRRQRPQRTRLSHPSYLIADVSESQPPDGQASPMSSGAETAGFPPVHDEQSGACECKLRASESCLLGRAAAAFGFGRAVGQVVLLRFPAARPKPARGSRQVPSSSGGQGRRGGQRKRDRFAVLFIFMRVILAQLQGPCSFFLRRSCLNGWHGVNPPPKTSAGEQNRISPHTRSE